MLDPMFQHVGMISVCPDFVSYLMRFI